MAKSKADTITDTDVLEAPQNEELTDTISSVEQAPSKIVSSYNSLKAVERDSRIFLLSNDKRQGNVIVNFEEDVIDPKTGKTRRMRPLRGAQSVWLDEQSPLQFPEKYVNAQGNLRTVTFSKGKVIIPLHDTLLLEAMVLSNRNTDNKNRYGAKDVYFYEWNPAKENAKQIAEENNVIKAMEIAFKANLEQMLPHIHYLNIQIHDIHGVPLDESALKSAYVKFAKNNPEKFLQSVASPNVKLGYMVRRAIQDNIIDLGSNAEGAYWKDGGFICTLPNSKDPVDHLIEFAMGHGEASVAFVNQLNALMT